MQGRFLYALKPRQDKGILKRKHVIFFFVYHIFSCSPTYSVDQ